LVNIGRMSSGPRDRHKAASVLEPLRISRDSFVQVASRDRAPCGLDVGPTEPGRWRPRPSPRSRKIGAPAERRRPLRRPCSSETERQRFTRRRRSRRRSAATDAGGSRVICSEGRLREQRTDASRPDPAIPACSAAPPNRTFGCKQPCHRLTRSVRCTTRNADLIAVEMGLRRGLLIKQTIRLECRILHFKTHR
jgi:hypothetical protein